ncbi:MAG: twin-arginine translocation signal domain-containing protein, partial [Gammaproteobacteria bacterium]|nr:twin-arginine translocation signal domain-containing protein [Gammaproteobacteria bacterium]
MMIRNFLGALAVAGALLAPLAQADTPPVKVGRFGQEVAEKYTTSHGLPSNDVAHLVIVEGKMVAVTASGAARFENGAWVADPYPTQDMPFNDVI